MNWGVVWYIDFADWSIISPCTEAIQTRVKVLVKPVVLPIICCNTILWQIRILLKQRVFAQQVTFILQTHV